MLYWLKEAAILQTERCHRGRYAAGIRISPFVIIVFGQSIFDYHLILPENSAPALTPMQVFRIRCAQKHPIFRLRNTPISVVLVCFFDFFKSVISAHNPKVVDLGPADCNSSCRGFHAEDTGTRLSICPTLSRAAKIRCRDLITARCIRVFCSPLIAIAIIVPVLKYRGIL